MSGMISWKRAKVKQLLARLQLRLNLIIVRDKSQRVFPFNFH